MTTEKGRSRGRPRRFDPEEAVATAQQLFHARGYDAVSVADVTGALSINPPSFYAAFGSKAGLFGRVLERWADTGAIPMADILTPDRPVDEALAALLEDAAGRYAADPAASGCLVLEGTKANDPGARAAACAAGLDGEDRIRCFIADRHPELAEPLTDFIATTMSGMSARARSGHDVERLLGSAKLASVAISAMLRERAASRLLRDDGSTGDV